MLSVRDHGNEIINLKKITMEEQNLNEAVSPALQQGAVIGSCFALALKEILTIKK